MFTRKIPIEGVEDDGCHSLLDYDAVAESARVLECIARSLNAVVVERKMIQNEIVQDGDGNVAKGESEILFVNEPPVFGLGDHSLSSHGDDHDHQNGTTKGEELHHDNEHEQQQQLLAKKPGSFTRAEVTIQRVETHLLDPSPISLAALADSGATTNGTNTEESSSSELTGKQLARPSNESQANGNNENGTSATHKKDFSIAETLSARNIRVAVVGNVDAGKSTMIGTLTTSSLDDGRGKSRTSIMKHRHEIESGRTSTATTHLMGFRSTGEPITGRDHVRIHKRKTEDEIARESYRIVTLMDLAGHEKYLKTT